MWESKLRCSIKCCLDKYQVGNIGFGGDNLRRYYFIVCKTKLKPTIREVVDKVTHEIETYFTKDNALEKEIHTNSIFS